MFGDNVSEVARAVLKFFRKVHFREQDLQTRPARRNSLDQLTWQAGVCKVETVETVETAESKSFVWSVTLT